MTGTNATAPDGETRPRARNPWGQGDRLRVEILRAAGQLLGTLGGEDGLTLRGVARQAGIAPASIYAHFSDRTALVAAVLSYEAERLLGDMRAAEAAVPAADAPGRLRAQLHAYCRYAVDNPGHYRLMFAPRPPELSDREHSPAWTVVESLTAGLARCAEAGSVLRLTPERAAIMLVVGTHGRVAIGHTREVTDPLKLVLAFADELLSLLVE